MLCKPFRGVCACHMRPLEYVVQTVSRCECACHRRPLEYVVQTVSRFECACHRQPLSCHSVSANTSMELSVTFLYFHHHTFNQLHSELLADFMNVTRDVSGCLWMERLSTFTIRNTHYPTRQLFSNPIKTLKPIANFTFTC